MLINRVISLGTQQDFENPHKKKKKTKTKTKTKQNKTKNNISILYIDYYLINKLLDIKILQLIYLPIAIQLTNPWILRFYM